MMYAQKKKEKKILEVLIFLKFICQEKDRASLNVCSMYMHMHHTKEENI